jgi:predicted nucleic acid-binding Zn ribbon protein
MKREKWKQKKSQPVLKDPERICHVCKKDYKAVSYMQKTCSKECRRVLYLENQKRFKDKNPGCMKSYNENRIKKNPTVWKDKVRNERMDILTALGGKCIVCGVTNPNWLHTDYIPTMEDIGYRHPRHKRWVLDHLKDFRILCANHHYELSITGKIEATTITQPRKATDQPKTP